MRDVPYPFPDNELGRLLAATDLAATPLGAPAAWPAALKTMVQLLLNSREQMFLVWGPARTMVYNDAYIEVLGERHPHALFKPFAQAWPELTSETVTALDNAFLGQAQAFRCYPSMLARAGRPQQAWFDYTYTPVYLDDGQVGCVLCILNEITGEVAAQRTLQRQARQLRQLFEDAPGFMALTRGPQHVYELANHTYRQLIGMRDPIGQAIRAALPELQGQCFFDLLDEVHATGRPYQGRRMPVQLRRCGDGPLEQRWVDFIYQPVRDGEGRMSGIFIQGSDVTEQVSAELALRESEAEFRAIANAIPQLVWSNMPDGTHVFFNDRWFAYTGMTGGITSASAWAELVHPDDREEARRRWEHALDSGEPYEIEYRLRHAPSGTYRWCLARAVAVRNGSGDIVRWMGSCTDVHDQREAAEDLKRASSRKDEFLAMLAHELRNPLAPLKAATDLLRFRHLDAGRVHEVTDVIDRQVRHMTDLVDDLLDVSRVTRGQVELDRRALDVKTVVGGAIEQAKPLIEARAHALHVHMGAAHAQVHGDHTRLVQVIVNLLTNAAKYTPQGGRIDVNVDVLDDDVRIAVTDNGSGMDDTLLPIVFDIFSQGVRTPDRAQGGLGIGLALVKSLVELHGGRVNAHSPGAGRGSTFTIVLPLQAQDTGAHGAGAIDAAIGGHAPRSVMVVDDNADAADSLGTLLEALGHRVHIRYEPAGVTDAARELKPDVFILDIGLPGIDGFELARRLRAQPETAGAYLVALTGYGQAHDRVLSRAAGFDCHFVKPVDIGELEQAIARASAASTG